MAQKVVIDVEARFIDNLTPKIDKADKAVDDLGKKKPKVVVDAETDEADKDIDQTGKKLDDLGKKKPKPKVGLEDDASKGLDKIIDKTKALADKVCSVAIKVRDNDTLRQLTRIDEKAKSIAGKTWTAAVKIKDMALAPLQTIERKLFSIKTLAMGIIGGMAANKYVKEPVQMYANKEDLVTQFAVMLKGKSDKPNYDAAEERISELTSFAGETPFTRDEIYQASRVLQTYTQGALATPDATGGLRMIGDIAAATGQEYTRVANYMGRLYNEVGRGGKSLGEPLMMLREIGALSAEQEESIKKIAEGSGTIDEKWEKIAGQFTNTDGMMKEMSNQMNNLMLGVQSFFKNNLYMKLGEGISESLKPFLIDFRKWRSDNADLIASWAEQVKDFAADASEKVLGVVRRTASRANKIMQSDEFQNADLFGKIGMLWEGAIKNPFADWWSNTVVPWWDGTAVPWLTTKAGELGTTIGGGLSNFLLTILGADTTGVASQGGEIAKSFVKGFKDAFDGGAVADAIIDAIGRVWDAMPMWAKMLVGGIGVSKAAGGIASMAGGVANFAGMASKVLGGETAFQGALSGGAAKFAGALGAGGGGATLAGASGATMAAIGGGAALGGLVGGATAISGGYDLYRGFKEGDATRKASGGLKLGGVAAGAATGAMLGSVVPVLGTAAGALIGAGVGGIGGWLGSNKIKKDAAENAKSLEDLATQAKDNSQASDVLAKKQEYLAETLGDVKLSYSEIQAVASNFLARGMTENMSAFSSATVNANKSMQTLEGTAENLNKLNWKASVGFKFDEAGKAEYTKAIEDYIASAEKVVEDKHYEFTAAVSMLIDPKGKNGKSIIESGDEFYNSLQESLDATETKLTKEVKIALKDGVIDADEQKIISDLQNKIAEITQKVASAESTAKMEALKIKFGGGAIDSESFAQLQEEIASQIESSTMQYDEALTTSITGLKLQLDEGAINQEEYDAQIAQLTEGYEANIGEIHANAESLQLEILGDAFDIDQDQLSSALHNSINQGIQPMNWSAADASRLLNIEGLSAQAATGIGTALQSAAETAQTLQVNATIDPTYKTSNKFKGTSSDFGVKDNYSFPTTTAVEAEFDPDKFSGSKSDFNIQDTYNHSTNVNVDVYWNYTDHGKKNLSKNQTQNVGGFRGGLFGGGKIKQFSDGGMVAGGAQLVTVAEEGSPEMIIPMSSQRRGRALKLWAQAGHMMRVPGFAAGGLVGGNADEGIRNHQNSGNGAAAGSSGTQVNVGGVTVEINVNGDGGNPNIAEAIAAQGQEIADQIAGVLADAFSGQFENTPTKGVA